MARYAIIEKAPRARKSTFESPEWNSIVQDWNVITISDRKLKIEEISPREEKIKKLNDNWGL